MPAHCKWGGLEPVIAPEKEKRVSQGDYGARSRKGQHQLRQTAVGLRDDYQPEQGRRVPCYSPDVSQKAILVSAVNGLQHTQRKIQDQESDRKRAGELQFVSRGGRRDLKHPPPGYEVK